MAPKTRMPRVYLIRHGSSRFPSRLHLSPSLGDMFALPVVVADNSTGETEWSLNGRHVSRCRRLRCNFRPSSASVRALGRIADHAQTGVSDIPLTENGEKMVKEMGPRMMGPGSELETAAKSQSGAPVLTFRSREA
jgi:hypothetical protein